MAPHHLSGGNFHLVGHHRKTLNINIPGSILLLFKSPHCTGCQAFEPIFYNLANRDQRVQYGVVDITMSPEVIQMSRMTSHPIERTPTLFLYIDGNPYAKYNGKKNMESIISFINTIEQSGKLSSGQMAQRQFVPQGNIYGGGGGGGPPQINQSQFVGQPQPQQEPKYWAPEMDNGPSLQSAVKGSQNTQYAFLGNHEEDEDEERLLLPDEVTPHNVPWEGSYKKFGTID